MVETLTEELEQLAKSFGSTTLNREDLERGQNLIRVITFSM
jgi:hypothetical protein